MKTKTAPYPLATFEVKVSVFVNAEGPEEARLLVNECLNRGMCNTVEMQKRISHDAVNAIVVDAEKYKL